MKVHSFGILNNGGMLGYRCDSYFVHQHVNRQPGSCMSQGTPVVESSFRVSSSSWF